MAAQIIAALGRAGASLAAAAPMLGAKALSIGKYLAGREIAAFSAAMSAAGTREYYYQVNSRIPNLVPDPSIILSLRHANYINAVEFQQLLAYNGIRYDISLGSTRFVASAWQRYFELSRPDMDVSSYWDFYLQQGVNPNFVNEAVMRNRLRQEGITREREELFLAQTANYDLTTVIALLNYEIIDEQTADNMLAALGFRLPWQRRHILDMKGVPSPAEILELYNRGDIPDYATARKMMSANGLRGQAADLSLSLARQIPGASDLIAMSVKEVWDEAVVRRWKYDEEFPAPFKFWMRKQGYDWGEPVPDGKGGELPGITWPQAYWRAHWNTMSPTAAYLAYHRLRPERIADYRREFPGIEPFTLNHLKDVLKIADYPEPLRNWLAAINFTLPGRVDLRRMFSVGAIDAPGLKSSYQDLGYRDTDAQRMADFTVRQEIVSRTNKLRAGIKSSIEKGYRVGWLDRDNAAMRLHESTIINPDELARWKAMAIVDRIVMALDNPWVRARLESIDNEVGYGLVDASVKAVRASFLRFDISELLARERLAEIGIVQTRIDIYLNNWRQQLYIRGSKRSAAQICQWLQNGLIGYGEAIEKLALLGYNALDAQRALTMCQRSGSLAQQKIAIATAKNTEQKRKQLLAALKSLRSERKAYQKELARFGTPAMVAKWYKRCLIDHDQALTYLMAQGWPKNNAELLLADARAGKDPCTTKPELPGEAGIDPDKVSRETTGIDLAQGGFEAAQGQSIP